MTWYIYILYSHKDRKLYVGCTSNFENRTKKHNAGQVLSTKNRRPLSLIHSENFENKTGAFKRERFLKSLWGARVKKNLTRLFETKVGLNQSAKPIGRPINFAIAKLI